MSDPRGAAGAARAAVRRAVFLDRDGTVIRNDGDLGDPDAVELLPGAAEAMRHRDVEQFSAHLQSTADARRRQMEADVADAMAEIDGPANPSQIVSMLEGANVDQVQNALRRLKSRQIVKTVIVTTKRVNKTMWVLT